MSIVIATIDPFIKSVYMYGDRRRAESSQDGSFTFDDNFQKVYQLTKSLMVGFTGSALRGRSLYDLLSDNLHLGCSGLLSMADSADISEVIINRKSYDSTFMIAGINDDAEPFIWNKSTSESAAITYAVAGKLAFCCATKELADVVKAQQIFVSTLRRDLSTGQITGFSEAISNAIIQVSLTNHFISAAHDKFEVI